MAANQSRLSIQGATDEILRRQAEQANAQASASYGRLQAPPQGDIAELRRQQAQFAQTTRDLDRQNSWMAIPALAPAAAVIGLEGAGMLAARGAATGAASARQPLTLLEREQWWRNSRPTQKPLSDDAKAAIWKAGRKIWARAHGKTPASRLDAHVHHREPLQWAHLKPEADPNRFANLLALSPEEHAIATRQWAQFARAFRGREPTPAEMMEEMLRIDRLVGPLVRRPGASRPNPPPRPPKRP